MPAVEKYFCGFDQDAVIVPSPWGSGVRGQGQVRGQHLYVGGVGGEVPDMLGVQLDVRRGV